MWLSSELVGMFQISKDTVAALREELAALRTERDTLRTQLISTQANFEWVRSRINVLEVERAQLLEKAYNIKTPVPEIARTAAPEMIEAFSFNDMGDDMARKLGFPVYESN